MKDYLITIVNDLLRRSAPCAYNVSLHELSTTSAQVVDNQKPILIRLWSSSNWIGVFKINFCSWTIATSVLTVVAVVMRSHPDVAVLDHIAAAISSCLDRSAMLSLAQACSFGSIRLLDRIWENADPEADKQTCWSICRYLRTDIHYYCFQFGESLRVAAEHGNAEIVRWILNHFSGCAASKAIVEEAARSGKLDILRVLLYNPGRNTVLWGGRDMSNAIEAGHQGIARWLYEKFPDIERNLDQVMKFAVRQGDMSLIRWLLDVVDRTSRKLAPPSMNDAAAGGHMDVLQWIYDQGWRDNSDHALEGAARIGRLDIVKWLVESGVTKGAREALQSASGHGYLPIVRWLLDRNMIEYPQFAVDSAIRGGQLDILEYFCEVGMANDAALMMVEATSNGHLHIVKWLHKKFENEPASLFSNINSSRKGVPRHTAMDRAAGNGHLELEYLHVVGLSLQNDGKSGAPSCSDSAFVRAASSGHFEVIKWLCTMYPQMCCPPSTTSLAARSGNLQTLQWLHHQKNVEWSTDAMDLAAEEGHIDVLKWLHENRGEGCTASAMNFTARNGHLKIVQWLHNNRTEGCTSDAMDFATDREHFEVLLFLRASRTEGCSSAAKFFAREHRQTHILKWLEIHYSEI